MKNAMNRVVEFGAACVGGSRGAYCLMAMTLGLAGGGRSQALGSPHQEEGKLSSALIEVACEISSGEVAALEGAELLVRLTSLEQVDVKASMAELSELGALIDGFALRFEVGVEGSDADVRRVPLLEEARVYWGRVSGTASSSVPVDCLLGEHAGAVIPAGGWLELAIPLGFLPSSVVKGPGTRVRWMEVGSEGGVISVTVEQVRGGGVVASSPTVAVSCEGVSEKQLALMEQLEEMAAFEGPLRNAVLGESAYYAAMPRVGRGALSYFAESLSAVDPEGEEAFLRESVACLLAQAEVGRKLEAWSEYCAAGLEPGEATQSLCEAIGAAELVLDGAGRLEDLQPERVSSIRRHLSEIAKHLQAEE